MALIQKENSVKKLNLKKAEEKLEPKKVKIKQLQNDQEVAQEFLSTKKEIKDDEIKLEVLLSHYSKRIEELARKDEEAKKLKSEVDRLQKRLDKNQEKISIIIDKVIVQMREGLKSLFWELKEVVGRVSIPYKEVCEQIVADKVINREQMDERYNDKAKRSVKEILLFEGEEIDI